MALPRPLAAALLTALIAMLCACGAGGGAAPDRGPVVLAAASLQEALGEAAHAWAASGHPEPVLSFAGSSALARQIKAGAPADLFVSADEPWMDELAAAGRLKPGTRRTLLGNALVLVAPAGRPVAVDPADARGLLAALGPQGRLALADPAAVPAGRYAKAAFTRLGTWPLVASRVAAAENVRAALALVERKAAPLGAVYATDAAASAKVQVAGRFPAASHPPIRYPIAQLSGSAHPDAAGFAAFLAAPAGQAIFARHGFTAPE